MCTVCTVKKIILHLPSKYTHDLLIHDSHFTTQDLPKHKGWGHSSCNQAVSMAKKSNSKQLALYHYSPNYNDTQIQSMEIESQKLFKPTVAAKQGLVIYI